MPNDINEIKTEVKEAKPEMTHRYFCEACTGVAFVCNLADNQKTGKYPKTCHACGASVVIKAQNFIKL